MHVFRTESGELIGKFAHFGVGVVYCRAQGIINFFVNYERTT